MKYYNKVMLYFWLFTAIVLFIVVTYMGITEGFEKWRFYYVFVLIALFAFVTRRWMMKRMEKQVKILEEQESKRD
jgi:SNF family Na+-dependent transporter